MRIRKAIYWWLVMQHFDSTVLGDGLPLILPRRLISWLAAPVFALLLIGCTTATLTNGQSTVTYKGAKVFSPTVLSLRSGACAVPAVDPNGVVTQPPLESITTKEGTTTTTAPVETCHTDVMEINGVDVKSLANIILTTVVAGLAAVAAS